MNVSSIKSAAIALAIAAAFSSGCAVNMMDQPVVNSAEPGVSEWVAPPYRMEFLENVWKGVAPFWTEKLLEGEETMEALVRGYSCTDEGKSLIEAFGDEFMPNALGRYETARDKAMELLQNMEEVFPQSVGKNDDTYDTYCRVVERVVSAHVDLLRARKVLEHFYLLHKAGVIANDELAKVDEGRVLIEIAYNRTEPYILPALMELDGPAAEFAEKFMPNSYKLYQNFAMEHGRLADLYAELCADAAKMNATYDELFLGCLIATRDLVERSEALVMSFSELYALHKIGDIGADELANVDNEKSAALKAFDAALPGLLREKVLDPIEMVDIPGLGIKIGRYEVTQLQWKIVMGDNPSHFKGDDLPVENVSWDDCQEFIKRLNSNPAVRRSGLVYRLPTADEWEFACRAGGNGEYGLLANGREGTLDEMGWYQSNSGEKTHPVGQKKPNAFGLYDMHGNVSEWCVDRNRYGEGILVKIDGSWHSVVDCGGCWVSHARRCCSARRDRCDPRFGLRYLGVRLVASAGQ